MVQAEWPDNLTDRKYKKKKQKTNNKTKNKKTNTTKMTTLTLHLTVYWKKNYGENDMIISLMAFFKKESNLKFTKYHNIKINPGSFGQIT